ncbi:hypothetical protein SVAN01_05839 [Stagonosporopsis vannaccii]|nr:hypothetical protein SVAN01_05839 [Stagonosporopsis vannaccii]
MLVGLLTAFATAILLFPLAFAPAAASQSPEGALLTLPPFEHSLKMAVTTSLFDVSDTALVQFAAGPRLQEPAQMVSHWVGAATIEVYMASGELNNVGYVAGPIMYDLVQRKLRTDCPDTIGGKSNRKCWGKWHAFNTRYRKDDGNVAETFGQVHVKESRYKNMQVRNLLIGAIAAAYEESTKLARNCYYAQDAEAGYRYCYAPLRVGAYTEGQFAFSLRHLVSDVRVNTDGGWHCCETREFVDKRLDELVSEFKSVYPTPRKLSRLAECHLGCNDQQREFTTDVDKILVDLINSGL